MECKVKLPNACQAEVTEEDSKVIAFTENAKEDWWWKEIESRLRGLAEHLFIKASYPRLDNPVDNLYFSDLIALVQRRSLILATAPGSTAGKPAPVRVSREWVEQLRFQMEMCYWWAVDKMLREKGIIVEPDSGGR